MHVMAQAFFLPKAGNTTSEYEDAYWPQKTIDRSAETFSFAIADGATEASFSGLWATMLVRAFCKGWLTDTRLDASLTVLQKKWFQKVSKKPLPWYAEEKMRSGAFSSLLGLTLIKHKLNVIHKGRWQAMAIGDSCLFQVRQRRIIKPFPYVESKQFNNNPLLLSSNPVRNMDVKANIVWQKGIWMIGDEFYLMTDALACWLLQTLEDNDSPVELLRDIGDNKQFSEIISELRESKRIRNDDVTFFRIWIV